ncbi:hypothetical protein D915_007102 [Fasciola hepatica]|uniref:Apple domain-containing protein n=1 Tax=Fasciola hepatica TaxID=6192 RepID=A0A4E0R5N9_FASHE|nr:hypothetical protein D915_007102 [Fasciola hepatica]
MCTQNIAFISLVVVVGIFSTFLGSTSNCPDNFIEVSESVCIIRIDRGATYCEAHQICEQEGKKRGLRLFIPGHNAPKIVRSFPDMSIVYTSHSAMLNRSNDLRAGWRVGDPGYAKIVTTRDDTTIPWHKSQPNNKGLAVGLYVDRLLVDASQDHNNATSVICEISSRSIGGKLERFQKNWPHPLDTLAVNREPPCGCFDSVSVFTLPECAKRCKQRTECRSFYFNEQNRECVLSLYVDSILPLTFVKRTGAWVRFGRPDW